MLTITSAINHADFIISSHSLLSPFQNRNPQILFVRTVKTINYKIKNKRKSLLAITSAVVVAVGTCVDGSLGSLEMVC